MQTPPVGDSWTGLSADPLPVAAAYEWAIRDDCGAVVLFSGTVRDSADGRAGVQSLTYEAYEEQVVSKMNDIVVEVRRRWPSTGRVALLHRTGQLELGESAVIIVVSSPHRPEAFEAARFGIDAVKASAPIWKREIWSDGADWGTRAQHVTSAAAVGSHSVGNEP